MGDKIIYKYNGQTRTYIVDTIEVIEDSDWTYLEQTKDNRITLITCVEDQPSLRRAIQGVESK